MNCQQSTPHTHPNPSPPPPHTPPFNHPPSTPTTPSPPPSQALFLPVFFSLLGIRERETSLLLFSYHQEWIRVSLCAVETTRRISYPSHHVLSAFIPLIFTPIFGVILYLHSFLFGILCSAFCLHPVCL